MAGVRRFKLKIGFGNSVLRHALTWAREKSPSQQSIVRFGDFEVDLFAQTLSGRGVRLTGNGPAAAETIERRGKSGVYVKFAPIAVALLIAAAASFFGYLRWKKQQDEHAELLRVYAIRNAAVADSRVTQDGIRALMAADGERLDLSLIENAGAKRRSGACPHG